METQQDLFRAGIHKEQQQDFLGRDKRDRNKQLIQFWMVEEKIRDFDLWWRSKGFGSRTSALVMIITKLVDDEKTMHDPRTLQPIENALRTLNEVLPVIEKFGLWRYQQK